jgi:hypothetical protein
MSSTIPFVAHPILMLTGVEQLSPPGPDSNYWSWSWVMKIQFQATNVAYVLESDDARPRDKPTFTQDNIAICAILSRTIHSANIRYARRYDSDARGMWRTLQDAHQNATPVSFSVTPPKSNASTSLCPESGGPPCCTFCSLEGHSLPRCRKYARIFSSHRTSTPAESCRPDQPSTNHPQNPSQANSGSTSAVQLGDGSLDKKEDPHSPGLDVEVARNAVASLTSRIQLTRSGDANLDSGCSISMTPTPALVHSLRDDQTRVRLADDSTVNATQKGIMPLHLALPTSVEALVVPTLHEPLISIAALCDKGLTVVFNKSACEIYSDELPDLVISGSPVGGGYRKGNLFYLPSSSIPVRPRPHPKFGFEPPCRQFTYLFPHFCFDDSLFSYHHCLPHSHRPQPIKETVLRELKVQPLVMNEV